jgi:hypothetical protein
MAKLDDHPTVIRRRERPKEAPPQVLDADRPRRPCLGTGADDVGSVAIERTVGCPPRVRGGVGEATGDFHRGNHS